MTDGKQQNTDQKLVNQEETAAEVSSAKTQQQEPGQKKSILDRALDAMESAVTSEKQAPAEEAQKEQQLKKKVWMVYGGVVGIVLIIALILRGLIH